MRNLEKKFLALFCTGVFLLGLVVGLEVTRIRDKQLNVLMQAYNYILKDWYQGVEDETIDPDFLNTVLNAIVNDNHTYYTSTIGSIDDSYRAGYGFSFYYYSQFPRIGAIEPASPMGQATTADGVKIEVGDYIVALNGHDLKDEEDNRKHSSDLDKYYKSATNPNETDVFRILKKDSQGNYDFSLQSNVYDFTVRAGGYQVETATGSLLDDDTGYLKIGSFELNTPTKVRHHLNYFTSNNVKNLIIDVRGNPGGFIDSVVEIASMFLPKDAVIAIFKYKNQAKEYFYDKTTEQFKYDNFFILTDGDSASASELLTGALVDNHVAIQVGQPTYGKGSAQKTIRLGIDEGQFAYTYAVWTTVGRENIHHNPIVPNSEHLIDQSGLHSLTFYDYSRDYTANQLVALLEFLKAAGLPIIIDHKHLWSDEVVQALTNYQQDQGLLASGTYDFNSFIHFSNLRLDSYFESTTRALNHCLEIIHGV